MTSASALHRIVYVSAAVKKLTAEELDELLTLSRARNAVNDVTGALLYADGDFIQLLEGPSEEVAATFQRIRDSGLHHSLIALVDAPIAERSFGNWSMAYSQASWEELQQVQQAWQRSGDAGVEVLRHFATGRSRFA